MKSHVVPAIAAALLAASAASAQPPGREALLKVAQEVEVSAAVEGVLTEVAVREGALVDRGERLLRVDDRGARLALEQARARLERADAEARSDVPILQAQKARELARSEYQRAVDIDRASPSSVSDRELARLRLAAEAADLDVQRAEEDRQMARIEWKRAKADFAAAEKELADCLAVSPITGLVVQRHKQQGEWVGRGEPVVTVVSVDRLRAEALVPAAEAPLTLVGQPAVFTTSLGDGSTIDAEGKVVFVSPRADPVTSLARVWVELPATDRRLRPGLRGAVRFLPPKE
ncbi:MAG: HlyD family efflux transporter periplasmic adaptor subunit [Planctomycetota bacterium]